VIFSFDELSEAPLVPGATYSGGSGQGIGGEVLHHLIPGLKNAGGIRYVGSQREPKLIVLTSTYGHHRWPDRLSADSRKLTYFGDNKDPERPAVDARGNRAISSAYWSAINNRHKSPPILYFISTGNGYEQLFVGLFAIGEPNLQPFEWVYSAKFFEESNSLENLVINLSRLRVSEIPRTWIRSCIENGPTLVGAPHSWSKWVTDLVFVRDAPDFALANAITVNRNREIGETFLTLCKKEFANDKSLLVWAISAACLASANLRVVDVRSGNNPETFEVAFENSRSSLFVNDSALVRVLMSRRNVTQVNSVEDVFDATFTFSSSVTQGSEIVVDAERIGIELDRIGVRDHQQMKIFIQQLFV
jgi:hypothetical protein